MTTANVSPIYDPAGRFTVWKLTEIYTGPTGTGQYVPKVDDLVVSIVDGVANWSRVSEVNIGSYISTLVPILPVPDNYLTPGEIALGVSPGAPPSTYLLYVNKRTVPYSAALDSRLQVYGSAVNSCKVFAGTDISGAGRVISATYDNGGNFVGEDVSLELVASDAFNNNNAIKVVQPFKTSANLSDGEVATAVFYDISGSVVAMQQLLVKNTAFVRALGAGVKTVVGVGLLTPFLSVINAKTISYPRNLTLTAGNLTGVVHYSDGTEVHLPVDGTRFSVSGLDSYDPTSVGVSFPLVIKYVLGVGEQAYSGMGGGNQVSDTYTLTTTDFNRQYQVRLFPFPKWLDTVRGYNLAWWLYDATRSIAVDVTNLVQYASGSPAFVGTSYGIKQTLNMQINMSAVGGNYENYIYTQEVDVKLQAPGTFRQDLSTPPNWYTAAVSGSTPMFGGSVYATFVAGAGLSKTFNVAGGFTTLQDWLTAYFTNSEPIVLTPLETAAPAPTHFTININGAEFQYAIANWNQPLVISAAANNNDTVYVRLQYAGQQMLELGIAGMPLYQKNGDGSYA